MKRTALAAGTTVAALLLAGCGHGDSRQVAAGPADSASAPAAAASSSGAPAPGDSQLCTSINDLAQPTTQAASQVPPSIMVVGYLQRLQSQMNTTGLTVSPKIASEGESIRAAATAALLQFSSTTKIDSGNLLTAMASLVTTCSDEGLGGTAG